MQRVQISKSTFSFPFRVQIFILAVVAPGPQKITSLVNPQEQSMQEWTMIVIVWALDVCAKVLINLEEVRSKVTEMNVKQKYRRIWIWIEQLKSVLSIAAAWTFGNELNNRNSLIMQRILAKTANRDFWPLLYIFIYRGIESDIDSVLTAAREDNEGRDLVSNDEVHLRRGSRPCRL